VADGPESERLAVTGAFRDLAVVVRPRRLRRVRGPADAACPGFVSTPPATPDERAPRGQQPGTRRNLLALGGGLHKLPMMVATARGLFPRTRRSETSTATACRRCRWARDGPHRREMDALCRKSRSGEPVRAVLLATKGGGLTSADSDRSPGLPAGDAEGLFTDLPPRRLFFRAAKRLRELHRPRLDRGEAVDDDGRREPLLRARRSSSPPASSTSGRPGIPLGDARDAEAGAGVV
jgi:hypothetical protein